MPSPVSSLFSIDLLICCITVLVSFSTAAYTYYKTKQLKFFDAYFSKKSEAYEHFIASAAYCIKTASLTDDLLKSLYIVQMYCASSDIDKVSGVCSALTSALNDPRPEVIASLIPVLKDLILSIRADIQNCRKYKFD